MHEIPTSIHKMITLRWGHILDIEKKQGVAFNKKGGCFHISLDQGSVIAKQVKTDREYEVYLDYGSFLKQNGIIIPEVYFAKDDWIVLEDIPQPFPKQRWGVDREQIKTLFNLHSSTWNHKLALTNPYLPTWTKELNQLGSMYFPTETIVLLDELQLRSKEIFNPVCCISGDPNPTNWGIRNGKELVLYDFGRFGYGTPAIDLAILMPGVGEDELSIATIYHSLWKEAGIPFPLSVDQLKDQMMIAKIWSILDFLVRYARVMDNNSLDHMVLRLCQKIDEVYVC